MKNRSENYLSRKLLGLVTAGLLTLINIQTATADVLATKEPFDAGTGAPLATVELGQTVEYSFNWSCNFTGTPPPGECGDFILVDPLPAGVSFVSCAVPGIYNCTYDPTVTVAAPAGTVTIEAVNPAEIFTNGQSASASIIVQLSTDPSDFGAGALPPLVNTATTSSADGDEDVVSSLPINPPENNWEISKSVTVPAAPLEPALDNNVVYEIEVCPNGPSGLGTGTIIIENPTLTDVCPTGAVIVGATLNGAAVVPTGMCPSVDIPLPATFDPADGCQVVELTLQYPAGAGAPAFAAGVSVTNEVVLGGDNVVGATCPNNCTDDVTNTLATPVPDAEIDKSAKRDEIAEGAFSRYTIRFDTTNANVSQTGMEITDLFPAGMVPISLEHRGEWSDNTVVANVFELGTGTSIEAGYDGDPLGFSHTFSAGATGFEVIFTTAVPPGFDGGDFRVNFRADPGLSLGDDFENCVEVSSDQILPADNPESCSTIDIVAPTSDIQLLKDMPDGVSPGATFTTRFDFTQDDTSSVGAVNPVITDCIPNTLEFVSWDSLDFVNGLDDPRDAVNTSNTNPLGVEPNFELYAPGDVNNTCADPTSTFIRWSWKASAPAGSTMVDGSPGVANPFTFPVRRDRIAPRDNVGDATGDLGIFVRVRMETTMRVKPGVPQQTGLSNSVQSVPENTDFRCLNSSASDTNDIDGDSVTGAGDPVCNRNESFQILSSAAFGGNKFVAGFPGLPNYDPDNPPADNTAAASTGIVTPASCPADADGRTRTPCVAQAMKDQPFNYRIRLSNDGNVLLKDYIVYDILPNTDTAGSDTGISEAQAATVRGSTWVPLLNGPVMVSSANAIVAAELAANGVVEYSASTNPCRPELSIANDTLGGDWQAGVCDDDWTTTPLADSATFPNGYASVRAWRLTVPFTAGWPVGDPNDQDEEDIVVDLEMLADPTAPASDYEALPDPSLEIAWNNVSFRATNVATDRRLLAAEAIKTGIVMPAEYPLDSTGLRIGNLVWVDADNDGLAEAGEQGIFDVTVQLWNDLLGDGPTPDDTLYDTTQTDAEGHYLFDDADLMNRDGLGLPAGDYYVVIPSAQTGSFVLSDNYSSTTDEEDADANVDNDDNGAFDAADLVTPVPGLDGIYSGTVNLALGDEPTDEELRNDDATDDDNDFFDDDDSNVSVDFGFYQLRLGNHVWLDTNNDGDADSNEPAIENMQVQLFLDNGDGVFDPDTDTSIGTDTTDAQGQYLFDGLDAGNYFVAIPSGQTGLDAGGSTFTTNQLSSSTSTSAAGAALGSDNDDDGAPGTFGSTTPVSYASVSTLLPLTVAGAQTGESDSSLDGVTGSSATDGTNANVELTENLAANAAFPDTNSYLTADFGFTSAVSLGSTIWVDLDADGTQDVGEGAIANATVTLLDAAGAVINDAAGNPISVLTDANGQYNFNQLPPGTYRVSVDLSTSTVPNIDDFFPSPVQVPNPENNSNTDSNIDFLSDPTPTDQTHISGPIILTVGGEPTGETDPINSTSMGALTDPDQPNQTGINDNSGNMSLDMGFVPPVSIGSTLWIDDNEDGDQDTGETPIVGASVTLLNADGTVFDNNPYMAGIQDLSVSTDADGQYNFDGLPPGDYRVRVNLSSATNSNAASLIPTLLQTSDPDAAGAGQNRNTDSNIDGTVPGSAVGTNAGDTATDQVHTSGVITLRANTEPVGEVDSIGAGGAGAVDQPNQGLVPSDDPDASGNMTVDFGFIEPVSLGSTVWFDSNGDGLQTALEPAIQGATITLLNADGSVYDTDPNTVAVEPFTDTTDAQGQYNFNGLPEGTYRVQVNLNTATSHTGSALRITPPQVADPDAPGIGQDNNTDSNIDITAPGHSPATNTYQSGIVELTIGAEPLAAVEVDPIGTAGPDQPNQAAAQPDANGNMTVDFGFFAPVSLGSTVWNDTNADGDQDSGEPAILGATVTLLNAAGLPVDGNPNVAGVQLVTTTTDAQGQYNFNGLVPGDYRVRVNLATVVGGDDYIPTPLQVADPDAAGAGLNNNTDSNIDTAFDPITTDLTHTSGVITLSVGGEPAGEVDPIGGAGSQPDQPNQTLTAVDDPDTSGNMTVDMGFIRPVSVGSTVWLDTNSDGDQDAGEPAIVGATVTLLNDDGSVFDSDPNIMGIQALTDTTDTTGQYNFNGLPEGDYRIQVNLATATNTAANTFVPTPPQVADPDAAGAGQNNNTDSNIDSAFDPIATDQIHTSGIISLNVGAEPVGETDPITTGGTADQPGQGLTADSQPDANGNMTVDLGFIEPVSLGSTIWFDSNNDGQQTALEPAIVGVTVTLMNADGSVYDSNPATPGIEALTDVTDADGQYNFNGLPAGDYRVQVNLTGASSHTGASLSPTPTQVPDPDAAGDNNSDSNVDSSAPGHSPATNTFQSGVVTLSVGGESTSEIDSIGTAGPDQPNQSANQPDASGNMSVDMGFFAPVSLGSTIWNDTNADGDQDASEPAIQGATVTLLNGNGTEYDSDPNTVGVQTLTAITDVNGQYNFDGLIPGDYRVQVNLASVTGGDDYIPTPLQVADPDAAGASFNSNEDSNIDVAFDPITTDQIHTSGIVTLSVGDEPVGETDPIDAGGVLVADQPNQGLTPGEDPDNAGNMTVDMGFIRPVSLGSTVWLDTDGDGTQDGGEPPIVGATITLLNSNGTVYDSNPATPAIDAVTDVTDSNGEYNFNGLPEGDYRVQVNVATASNTNALFFVPTLPQVADPDAPGPSADSNADSNIDTAFDPITTDQIHTSGIVSLTVGGEPITEADPIGAGLVDQPNQGLTADSQPDANGNMTVDFGFMEPVSLGSTVWFDSDTDGTQDDNEPPIAGAVVTLLNDDLSVYDSDPNTVGVQVLTATTDGTGQYNFNGLPAGSYVVQVSLAGIAGANSISPSPVQVSDPENNTNSDSNIATTDQNGTPTITSDDLYRSGIIVLSPRTEPSAETDPVDGVNDNGAVADQPNQAGLFDGSGNMTVDFGFFQPVSLGSTIWEDINVDGMQTAGEPAIVGATVTLLDAAGVPVAGVSSVVTNAEGEYNFDGLLPGDYRVRVDLSTVTGGEDLFPSPIQEADPDAPGAASENSNEDSNLDFAFDTTGTNVTTDQVHTSGVVTLTPGTEPTGETDSIGTAGPDQPNQDLLGVDPDAAGNMTVDMGFVRPVSLGSTVWQDENADGTQDDGEPTIVGATVTLLDSAGDEVDGDPYTAGVQPITTITDAQGQYFFNGLPAGDYRVQVDLSTVTGGGALIPSPTQVADPDAAGDDNTDSNVDIPFDTNTADQIHTSGVIALTVGGEPTGEVDPIDLVDGNGDVSDAPGQTASNPDNSGNMTLDMGFYSPVSVGSLIWEDTNGDGLQDASEPPLAGATIELLVQTAPGVFASAVDVASAVVASVTVGADGLYEFTNLPPGDYKVRVSPPTGYFPSPVQNTTSNNDTENDSNIASEPSSGVFDSAVFSVTSGGEPNESGPDTNRGDSQDGAPGSAQDLSGNMTIDFGFVPPASLGNYVWLDLDMDGVQDANEDGIANVTVNLYQDQNGDGVINGAEATTPVATATTGPNGEYIFPNLQPGVVYQTGVDVSTLTTGLVQTYDEGDGVGATDSLSAPITLDPNEFHETADFGYAPATGVGAVGDTIWVDADDDGQQDPGEPGIAGVTVSITPPPDVDLGSGLGVPITTVTDNNGKYLFPNLPLNETYIVEVDTSTLPTGYVSGPSNLGDPDVRDGNSTDADDQTTVVITTQNPINLDLDFGYLPPADQNNSVGNTLWIDIDMDGNGPSGAGDESDTTELPLPGVTVSLVDVATGDVIATTITDANGQYLFTGVPDGNYEVRVTDQNNVLAGLSQTVDSDDPANPGSFVATTPNVSVVDLDSASTRATPVNNVDQDFGYVDSSSSTGDGTIGDTIFFDSNNSGTLDDGEGLEGVTVQLYAPGPDGVIGGGDDVLIGSTQTDENGNYLFTGLDTSNTGPNPGTEYQVVVDTNTLPNGGSGWSNSIDPDTVGTGDSTSITSLTTANSVDLNQDFGYVGSAGNSLSGTLWSDANGDGMFTEAGVFSGVTIEVRDQDGNVIQTVVTDSDGNYAVNNLPDGVFTVVVTDDDNVLNGFEHTDSPNGSSDTTDNTSKDDTGYVVDLDSSGTSSTPVADSTGDFGYQPSITNPISLGSFRAESSGDNVTFVWRTQTEVANLGFYLYANQNGEWVLLNPDLILGQGDSVQVQEYRFTVETTANMFALSDVDLTGKETLHGPFEVDTTHGVIGDRQSIDWNAERSEREAKELKRTEMKMRQQRKRSQKRVKQLKGEPLSYGSGTSFEAVSLTGEAA